LVYCKMSVGSTHHLEVVFVWKQNYILVDEYFFFCCTWIVNSARKRVAKYKYPEHIVVIEKLPRTTSGKIQKFLLRKDIMRRLTQDVCEEIE
ncbi:hypothetical protein, partial [Escherichia coli]|uniref:hypothetical protein n=1 Tax=Escherichia coli TaxID=562 RepID=UPI001BFC015B